MLYQDLENYIAFYNDERLHQSLNYATTLPGMEWQLKREGRASYYSARKSGSLYFSDSYSAALPATFAYSLLTPNIH